MAEPLKGLRAIEFGQLLAGPFTGTLLGDFGADVIKIEAPGDGDAMRDWGRLRTTTTPSGGRSWPATSARWRSICAGARAGDRRRLAATADIVLENFRPARWRSGGWGRDDLHARNPRCIYARVSGFGQTGRYRDRPGFASAGEAISGLRYINGYPDQAPPRWHQPRRHARRPVRVPGHSARALRPREAAPRVRSWTQHRRHLLHAVRVGHARVREDRLRARADRPAPAPDRPQQRLLHQGRQVGRDRRQPRHVVAPAGEDHGQARSWARTNASPPTTRAGSTRICWTRSSADSRGGTRPASSNGSSTRAASSALRSTRRRTSTSTALPRARAARGGWRTRSTGA